MNKNPEQTKATRSRIIQAFLEISREEGIHGTSVSAVAEKANVNRSTFYKYFLDVYDVLEQYENELLYNIKSNLEENLSRGLPEDLSSFSAFTVSYFDIFGEDIYYLLGQKGDPSFQQKLKSTLIPIIQEKTHIYKNIENIDFVITYVFSALTGLLSYWHETGKKMDSFTFVNTAQKLVATGIQGYTGIKIFHDKN